MKWQPIATAEHMKKPIGDDDRWHSCPRVLLWADERCFTGRWDRDLYAKKSRPYWDMDTHLGKQWIRANQPTHWAQIEPPQEGCPDEEPANAGDEISQQAEG